MGKRIIGKGGRNMKEIVEKAGVNAKLRLRGKGSGFVEHNTDKESEEPLQLCISCTGATGYDISVQHVDRLLREIYSDYDHWCHQKGLPNRAPAINMRERRGPGASDFSHSAPSSGGGNAGRKKKNNRKPKDQPPVDDGEDKGEPPPDAPPVEEIERMVTERNQARKDGEYKRADQIRDELQRRKVVLSDEKGASGHGLAVTSWRYWRENGAE